ncbi:hypothetical protein AMECASPLE_023941 [Ameca splendens]|uniref:Uncharacterized protein n=1 Tax=Ameca splendens TaxID=208324 RepID=A0ABV0XH94_9TELE
MVSKGPEALERHKENQHRNQDKRTSRIQLREKETKELKCCGDGNVPWKAVFRFTVMFHRSSKQHQYSQKTMEEIENRRLGMKSQIGSKIMCLQREQAGW